MPHTISDFAAQFQGGVRANLFRVSITGPEDFSNIEFLCKGAGIPASTIGVIPVPYRGRQLQVPGDRSFEDWTVTILNDPDWQNRTAIEQWMNAITSHSQNTSSINASDVYGNATVTQLSREGGVIRTYRIQDMYPTVAAPIELTMDPDGAPEEFAVTFAFNNFTVDGSGLDGSSTGGVDISVSGSITLGGVTIGVNV